MHRSQHALTRAEVIESSSSAPAESQPCHECRWSLCILCRSHPCSCYSPLNHDLSLSATTRPYFAQNAHAATAENAAQYAGNARCGDTTPTTLRYFTPTSVPTVPTPRGTAQRMGQRSSFTEAEAAAGVEGAAFDAAEAHTSELGGEDGAETVVDMLGENECRSGEKRREARAEGWHGGSVNGSLSAVFSSSAARVPSAVMSTKSAAPPRSPSRSLRVVSAQHSFLSQLGGQLRGLQSHPGTFGGVQIGVEGVLGEVGVVERQLDAASLALSSSPSSASAPPDLDSLACQLESLARHISHLSRSADDQSKALVGDMRRVMEVVEDPAMFLPAGMIQPVSEPVAAESKASSSKRGRKAQPMVDSTNLTPAVPEEDPIQLLPEVFTTPGLLSSPPSDEVESLDQFRLSVARTVAARTAGREVHEARESIRRVAREAGANQGAAQRLKELTAPTTASARTRGKKVSIDPTASVAQSQPARPRKSSKPMSNPSLYPWTSALQSIFSGVVDPSGSGGGGGAMPFGGLAQAIPAYEEMQRLQAEHMRAQVIAQQQDDARRLALERAERDQAARDAVEQSMRAKKREKQRHREAEERAEREAEERARLASIVPALPLPLQAQREARSTMTSPRLGQSWQPHPEPLKQRFEAVWEVLPSGRDVSSQSEPVMEVKNTTLAPPQPAEPAPVAAQPAAAPAPAAQPASSRRPAPKKKDALSELDRLALDLQSKQRGSQSSTSALDELLKMEKRRWTEVPSSSSAEPLVPQPEAARHPLFTPHTSSALTKEFPSHSGLLGLVMTLSSMPSDAQVDAEWARVVGEEEKDAGIDIESKAEGKEQEQLVVPSQRQEEEEYQHDFDDAPPAAPVARDATRDQPREVDRREQEAARQREVQLEAARLVAEAEAKRLATELRAMKEAQAQVSPPAPTVVVTAAPSTDRHAWEFDLRARWEAEHAIRQAGLDEKAKNDELLKVLAVTQEALKASQAVQAELIAARHAPAAAPTIVERIVERQLPPVDVPSPEVAAEVARIRSLQTSEAAAQSRAQQEAHERWSLESKQREEERLRLDALHREDEARYELRRAEREAEDARRAALEQRRDELLQQRVELEAERTRKEMESLRASMERMKSAPRQQVESIEPTFVPRAPLSSLPRRAHYTSSETDSSWDSAGDMTRRDLSDGEVDLRGARSPGLILPPRVPLKAGLSQPMAKKPSSRHSAAVLHPPHSSITPSRPTTAEQKYPTTQPRASTSNNRFSMTSTSSSSSREDIAELLRGGGGVRDSVESVASEHDAGRVGPSTPPYPSAVAAVQRALAGPSRQVIIGGDQSPPLMDSADLSRLVRDSSIDAGASSDNIGGFGLFGMERPQSSPSMLAESRDLEVPEEDFSFDERSPNEKGGGATEQWLKSLREE